MPSEHPMSPALRLALGAQAAYYVVTGLWPLIHLSSFEAFTGPKTDDWLVHMVGLLAVAIGAALAAAVRSRDAVTSLLVLALASAAAFTAIDVRYVSAGVISPIYLADAAGEAVLFAWVASAWRAGRRRDGFFRGDA